VALDYRIRNRNRTRTKTTFPTRAEFCNLRLKALCSMDQNNVAVEIELNVARVARCFVVESGRGLCTFSVACNMPRYSWEARTTEIATHLAALVTCNLRRLTNNSTPNTQPHLIQPPTHHFCPFFTPPK